jgi:hypothetical protein
MTGACGIPETALALSLNFTVVAPAGAGHLTVWPTGVPEPAVSTLNYLAGQTVANAAIVTLGTGGQITVESFAAAHLVVDVNGYFANTVGEENTALGELALASLTAGTHNTAVGNRALISLTSAQFNTAVGSSALGSVAMTGNANTAVGALTLVAATSGASNVGVGAGTLLTVTSGGFNTAIGPGAGGSLQTGSNNVYIGNVSAGAADEASTTRIGNVQTRAFVAGIRNTIVTGVPVVVSDSGQLGVASSTARVKRDIRDMGAASRDLLKLRPVIFRYRAEHDDGGRRLQYGLIAEEVAEIHPELVVTDPQGQVMSVRYDLLPAMLLNELQRQQRELEQQKAEAEARFAAQQREIAELRQLVGERIRARH